MAAKISTSPPPPHLIAILMSTSGRFVVCRGCHLRFAFPAEAHFDLIAKQFESHLCDFQCLSNDGALSPDTATPYDLNSETLNRFDFDHNATPMWVFDISTLVFSAVNDAAVLHYGYSRKEFLSMTILDIRPSEDIPFILREVLQKRVLNSVKELRKHKKKDGSLIDVEVTRCEVLFNGCIADIVTAVDVTGRVTVPSPHRGTQPDAA
ncbi:MAG TPA: PAS domain S-box protein [Candidatus Polarisedimenticolia bacterium]|nr:PAS domain S-box protein [Candidatus Polarisedimenticolia bacterium]